MNKKGNILFLGVGFHIYDNAIVNFLSDYYNVTYINTDEFKVISPKKYALYYRLKKYGLIETKNQERISRNLQCIEFAQFDLLFVIKGANLNDNHLDYIEKRFSIKNKILYLWDGYKNHTNIETLVRHFHKIYSFDYRDCDQYGFIKRPLFFIETNNRLCDNNDKDIDLSFVGANHSQRLKFLRDLKEISKKSNLNYFFFLSTGIVGIIKGFVRGDISLKDLDIVKKGTLAYSTYLTVTRHSKAIVDFPNYNQTGLTIRTIEALSVGTKVITTNEYILHHNDIPRDLFLIWNNDSTVQDITSFLKKHTESSLPDRYSMYGFFKELSII